MSREDSPLRKALADACFTGYSHLLDHLVVPSGVEDAKTLAKGLSDLCEDPPDKNAYGVALSALPELFKAYDLGVDLGIDENYLVRTVHAFLFSAGRDSDKTTNVRSSSCGSGADLTQAYLTNANLTVAYLPNANLSNANLHWAVLTGVVWSNTTCPDGTNSDFNGGTCERNL